MHTLMSRLACCVLCGVLGVALAVAQAERPYQAALQAYRNAQALERDGKQAEAMAAFEQMTVTWPRHDHVPLALIRVGTLGRALNRHDRALAAYDWLVKQFPLSDQVVNALTGKAQLLGAMGEYADAAAVYAHMGATYFGHGYQELWLWMAVDHYTRAGDLPRSIAAADTYVASPITEGARRAQVLRIKLNHHITREDVAGIEATLAEMAKLPAETTIHAEAARTAAAYYVRVQQYEKAAQHLQAAAAALNGGGAQNDLYYTGVRLVQAEKYPEAIAAYRAYLQRFPRGFLAVNAYTQIANLTRDRLQNREQEIVILKELLAACPDTYDASVYLLRLAQSYNTLRDYDNVQTVSKQLLQQFPGTLQAAGGLWLAAEAMRIQGKPDDARTLYHQLVKEYDGTSLADNAAGRLAAM